MIFETVLTEEVHELATDHLLQHLNASQLQEDLCFALWRPSTGANRKSAIIFEIILPISGDRNLHGNVSFEPSYLTRAIRIAIERGCGLAFMHNHFSNGWQDMSLPDVVAERDRISPGTRATGLPLVGLTLGKDQSWSARFWNWDGQEFCRTWCEKVRVVGRRFRVSFKHRTVCEQRRVLRRTVDTWGAKCQRDLSGLHFGIVGVGSVGCVIAETLARMGMERLTIVDPDRIESHNLDRLLYATEEDVCSLKVALVEKHASRSATASNFEILSFASPVQDHRAFSAILDCDILFSATDRPLPKDLINHLAYAHCIPVISGGVFIDNKPDSSLGQAAWGVTTVGPRFRCLRCDGQYTSSDVVIDLDGSLNDPTYVRNLKDANRMQSNQNVFPFSANLATAMVIAMTRLVIAERWWPDRSGQEHYSLIPNRREVKNLKCNEHCSVVRKTALGDYFQYPFLCSSSNEAKSTGSALTRFLGGCKKQLVRISQLLWRS